MTDTYISFLNLTEICLFVFQIFLLDREAIFFQKSLCMCCCVQSSLNIPQISVPLKTQCPSQLTLAKIIGNKR